MVEVYRRRWFWTLFGSPHRAALGAVVLGPFVYFMWPVFARGFAAIGGALATLFTGDPSVGGMIAGGFVALVAVPITVRRVRDFRRRVEVDHARREIRFVGFVRWDPWWRPRLGPFAVPFGRVNHVERLSWRRGYDPVFRDQPVRVIAGRAVVDIPAGMRGADRLEGTLRALARATPGVPDRMTEAGFERLVMNGVWVFWAAGLVIVALWLIPSVA